LSEDLRPEREHYVLLTPEDRLTLEQLSRALINPAEFWALNRLLRAVARQQDIMTDIVGADLDVDDEDVC
jgi:hypothetical protein